jgi:hypothetical protein
LSNTGIGWHDGEWIERPGGSGRELCWFPDPVGPHDCYRAELTDPLVMHAAFPAIARISARVSATRRDRLTSRMPMLSPPHREGGVGAVRVEVRGGQPDGARETLVAGVAARVGTAAAAVAGVFAMAVAAGDIDVRGVVLPGDALLPNELLLDRLRADGLGVEEFVGQAGSPAW